MGLTRIELVTSRLSGLPHPLTVSASSWHAPRNGIGLRYLRLAESVCGYVLEIIGGWLTLSSVKELQNMGILSIGWMAFQEAAVRARRRDNNLVLIYFLEIPPYGDHLAHGKVIRQIFAGNSLSKFACP